MGTLALTLVLTLAACDSNQSSPPLTSNANSETVPIANAAADVDSDLDAFARALALSLSDNANLRTAVQTGTAEKFNGDTEILFSDISGRNVDGTTFKDAMTASFAQADGLTSSAAAAEIDRVASAHPRLHIALRGQNAESWDPVNSRPLVAFAPQSIDDIDVEEVKAYDPGGNVVMLDGQVEPEQPVIVVGLNERVDTNGALLPEYLPTPNVEEPPCLPGDDDCGGGGGGGGGGSDDPPYRTRPHPFRLHSNVVRNDRDAWWQGDAEIYYAVSCQNLGDIATRASLPMYQRGKDSDPPNTEFKVINRFLLTWASGAGDYCGIKWWEEDGGDVTPFSISIGPFSLGYNAQDENDDMGAQAISMPFDEPNVHPAGTDPDYHPGIVYNTGDMEWTLN